MANTVSSWLESNTIPGLKLPHPAEWKGGNANKEKRPKRATRIEMIRKLGAKNGKHLTDKQARYVAFLAQGYSKRESARRAGYSIKSYGQAVAILNKSEAVQSVMQSLLILMEKNGVDDKKWAAKFAEWADAEKVVAVKDGEKIFHPDYEAQMKAYDKYRDLKKKEEELENKDGQNKVSRRITLEEFIKE